MGFFKKILAELGIGDEKAADAAIPSTPPPSASSAPASPPVSPAPSSAAQPAVKPVALVDVVAQLEQRAAANPEKLNWRNSIVDLLKLLGLDSSITARKELAQELGCPPELMADSAKMNMWLHRTVLARIAANGGNVPRELMD